MPSLMPLRAGVVAAVAVVGLSLSLSLVLAPAAEARSCRGADNWVSLKQSRKALLCLVNVERAKRGLRPMKYNRRLSRVARVHSVDLVRFKFVGHHSPAHGSLMRRVKRSGWARGRSRWTFGEIMGDGLNAGGTPRRIVRAWMQRSIHTTAILHPRFTSMGVGATYGRPRGGQSKRGGRTYVMVFAG